MEMSTKEKYICLARKQYANQNSGGLGLRSAREMNMALLQTMLAGHSGAK